MIPPFLMAVPYHCGELKRSLNPLRTPGLGFIPRSTIARRQDIKHGGAFWAPALNSSLFSLPPRVGRIDLVE